MTTQKDHVCSLKSVRSNRFLYDGWNAIAELNATNNTLIRGYIWGIDLSGSLPAVNLWQLLNRMRGALRRGIIGF